MKNHPNGLNRICVLWATIASIVGGAMPKRASKLKQGHVIGQILEILKHANNNHFPFHTCNLSYRCGIHITQFPTFLTRSKTAWKAYTEFANGTELILDARDYCVSGDMVMRKVADHQMEIEEIRIPCFESTGKLLSCYDKTFGNFIEFQKSWRCLGKVCYELADPKEHTMQRLDDNSMYAKLQAASKEDLLKVIANEHMLNEEMRYNFGLVLKELTSLKKTVINSIVSSAKIDDRLIGSILGYPAKTQFVSENEFYLLPCAEVNDPGSNCYKNLIFKNGRWIHRENGSDCLNLTNATPLNLFKQQEMWFAEMVDEEPIGTAEDFEGWTYFAKEQQNFKNTMEWTKSGRSSSMNDLLGYPSGFFNKALVGFLTSNIAVFLLICFIISVTSKLTRNARRIRRAVQAPLELHIQNIVQNRRRQTPVRAEPKKKTFSEKKKSKKKKKKKSLKRSKF